MSAPHLARTVMKAHRTLSSQKTSFTTVVRQSIWNYRGTNTSFVKAPALCLCITVHWLKRGTMCWSLVALAWHSTWSEAKPMILIGLSKKTYGVMNTWHEISSNGYGFDRWCCRQEIQCTECIHLIGLRTTICSWIRAVTFNSTILESVSALGKLVAKTPTRTGLTLTCRTWMTFNAAISPQCRPITSQSWASLCRTWLLLACAQIWPRK